MAEHGDKWVKDDDGSSYKARKPCPVCTDTPHGDTCQSCRRLVLYQVCVKCQRNNWQPYVTRRVCRDCGYVDEAAEAIPPSGLVCIEEGIAPAMPF